MAEEGGGHEGSESGAESHAGEEGEESHEACKGHEGSEESGKAGNHKGGKEGKSGPKSGSGKGHDAGGKKSVRTLDGAVALIVYQSPETGEVEFYFEEKPQDYYIRKYRGKLSLVGGAIDSTDRSSLDALVREFGEEIETWKARDILQTKARLNGKVYHKVLEYVNGEPAVTYVYAIKITSSAEWNAIRKSGLRDDAGASRILTMDEILKLGYDDFAFNQWEVIHRFIQENYLSRQKKSSQDYRASAVHSANAREKDSGSASHGSNYTILEQLVKPPYLRNFYEYKTAA